MARSTRSQTTQHERQIQGAARESVRRPAPSGGSADVLALQRKAGNRAVDGLLGRVQGQVPPIVEEVLHSGDGQPLDPAVRKLMEARFSDNFGHVRVHTASRANQVADAMGAQAFTIGSHIVFGEGRYTTKTSVGRELLAHELAHVVQASRSGVSMSTSLAVGDAWEDEAVRASKAVESEATLNVSVGAPSAIRMRRDPNLPSYLQRLQEVAIRTPLYASYPEQQLKRIFDALEGVDLADPENLQPITSMVAATFPRDVLMTFLDHVEQMVREDNRREVDPLNPYGRHGVGVTLPVAAKALRGVEPLVTAWSEGSRNLEKSGAAFVNGLLSGLAQSPAAGQIDKITTRLLQSSILIAVFPPVFTTGVTVGIAQDVVKGIKSAVDLIVNFNEVVLATLELVHALFTPQGKEIAFAMGEEIGQQHGKEIAGMANANVFEFTYNLGRKIGPPIVYTVLAFLGIPGLAAAAVLPRVLRLLDQFPRLSRLRRLLRRDRNQAEDTSDRRGNIEGSGDLETQGETAAPASTDLRGKVAQPEADAAKPAPAATQEAPPAQAAPAATQEVPAAQAAPAATQNAAAPEVATQAPSFYDQLTLAQLRAHAGIDPEAVWALRQRYRNMPDRELNQRANRGDAMAQSVRDQRIQRNRFLENVQREHGPFSRPGVQDQLETDIQSARTASGISRRAPSAVQPDIDVEGGTIGAARTNVPGIENRSFVGRSPKAGGAVNPSSQFPPSTDPQVLRHTHGHAEQSIADQLDMAFSNIPRSELQGRRVWMLIEQEPCPTCAAGLSDPAIDPGVLRRFSERYPELTLEVKNLQTGRRIVIQNGQEVK